ncbi:MAG: VIT1/CCC1 transporter family protein [Candidatus Omnitrophica bacterium]|nr:VIT1/CCC1 transporter family protein [Candidatus Omnitrophota bacterium]MDD5553127.1 VIT1/CCC1 transporter family protein [Candidatus Omnitrophota bacterium]
MDRGLIQAQRNELTDHIVYKKLAGLAKNAEHRRLLRRISEDEIRHYGVFKTISGEEIAPDRFKVFLFTFISRFLGLNFGLKLMESGEDNAQDTYARLKGLSPEIESMIRDEESHEKELISLIDEDRLKYVSSMVLGLNDALVELTGALAGFTLALNNTRLIGMIGLITGLAASMSMASSEYLSTKHEETDKNPLKASIYTGIAYVGTVLILVTPYFFINNVFYSLGLTLLCALLIMFIFTYYVSIAKDLSFRRRFFEMAGLSLGIATISFFIGLGVRKIFGVE